MSYTGRDWLGDQPGGNEITVWFREDGYAAFRATQLDALVNFATERGADPSIEALWDDETLSPVLLAVSQWRKDRAGWKP